MSILREKARVIDYLVELKRELSYRSSPNLETGFELGLRELRGHGAKEYASFAGWYGEYLVRTYVVQHEE